MQNSSSHSGVLIRLRRHRRASLLLDALMAAGVIATAIVAGVTLWNRNQARQAMNDTQGLINSMSGGIVTLYSSQSNYNGIDESVVLQSGVVPTRYRFGVSASAPNGTAITHPLSGQGRITVKPATINSIADAGFAIVLTGVNQDNCINIASQKMPRLCGVAADDSTTSVSACQTYTLADVQTLCTASTTRMTLIFE